MDIVCHVGRVIHGSLFCPAALRPPASRLLDADQSAGADLHHLWTKAFAEKVVKFSVGYIVSFDKLLDVVRCLLVNARERAIFNVASFIRFSFCQL